MEFWLTCSLDGFPSFWLFQTREVVFNHPFPSQIHRFVPSIFYLANFYIRASSQLFFAWDCARVLPVRSEHWTLNGKAQGVYLILSDEAGGLTELVANHFSSHISLVAWGGCLSHPHVFLIGGGDGWFWSCLADFSLFNFKILFFPGEHLKNRRAPSSNDLFFSGVHDKANQISDSWFHLRTQWSHPKILFLKSPKGSCVGPKDSQPFGAPEKDPTWKGEQGSRLISNSWSLLYSICVKNNSLSCILTERT